MTVKRHRVHWDITAQNATDSAMRAVEGNLQRVNGAAEQLGRTFRSALVATALIAMTRESARAAMEAEQASARLTAVLRATGHQAGLTKRDMDELADAMADVTQFDDESLREAMGTLLKFGNIQGDVFREGLKLSADLAAFMGTNVPEAAQMIGKSLQSPTEGLTMMERQFGKLTTAQKDHIEQLVRQGKAIEAQNAVLDIWRSKIGGTADIMNTGLKKATSEVGKAWDEMLESLGRTETVGGMARDILGGIRDILKDIKGLTAGPDPMKKMLLGLEEFNEELARLEGQRGQPTQAARAGLGQTADQAARSQIESRIAELKAQREQLLNAIRVLNMAGDQSTMDARDLRLRAQYPVKLGGKADDSAAKAEAERARRLREEDIRNLVRGAEEVQDESDKLIYTWDKAGNRVQVTREEFKKMQEEERRAIASFVESAEIITEQAEGMIYTWDQAGHRIEITREAFDELAKQQKKSEEAARDLGLTFSSAFEDAVVEGKKLSEVLKGLEKDIVRIIVRKGVTEPMANEITGAMAGVMAGLFGGSGVPARAGGGDVAFGMPYMVGERGPELFVPSGSGSIVPNDRLGGMTVTVNQNIHVDSRSDQASIMIAMHAAKEQAKAEIARSIRSGSGIYRTDL